MASQAVACGLLLDPLATGDREGVNQAYEHFVQLTAPAAMPGQ